MNSAIEGPDCLNICHGDCCSIKIDIPKLLAEEYIRKGYAYKTDFIRSNVFSFKLRFDEKKAKCFLYDKNINGCLVHNSGIKPPQCWIYPTNFSNPKNVRISCKRANGWKILDSKKTKKAEDLLQYYVFLCKLEAKSELGSIKKRISSSILGKDLKNLMKKTSPHLIAGFKDTWDNITILSAEGISLQMTQFCKKNDVECEFLECTSVCDMVFTEVIKYLQQNLTDYVINSDLGPDGDGEYPIIKLKEVEKEK